MELGQIKEHIKTATGHRTRNVITLSTITGLLFLNGILGFAAVSKVNKDDDTKDARGLLMTAALIAFFGSFLVLGGTYLGFRHHKTMGTKTRVLLLFVSLLLLFITAILFAGATIKLKSNPKNKSAHSLSLLPTLLSFGLLLILGLVYFLGMFKSHKKLVVPPPLTDIKQVAPQNYDAQKILSSLRTEGPQESETLGQL